MPSSRRIPALLGVAALAAAGAVWFGVPAVLGPRVAAVHAVRQPLTQTLLVTGRVSARGRTDLGAMLQGTVTEVLVEEGDLVEPGTELVHLADGEQQARLAEAQAQVAEARARLSRLRGVGRSVAQEQLEQARLEDQDAARELDRQLIVHAAGDLSEAALDAARHRSDTARSRRVAAELEVAATGAGGADLAAAAASLARAQAGAEAAQVALDRSRVRAPTAGRILDRTVEPGQVVRPGDPLLSFSGDGPLEVEITPDEVHLGRLRVGQPAAVALQAFADHPLSATVSRFAPQVDPGRGTVRVWLTLDEAAPAWVKPDMTATVEVVLGESPDALVLPVERVQDRAGAAPWVLTVEEGRVARRPVQLGLVGVLAVEVTAGLAESEPVLSVEAGLAPGDRVRVQGPTPALAAP